MYLANAGNTFGSGGSVIEIQQGLLAFSNNAALGNSSNVINLNGILGSAGLRATGGTLLIPLSISTNRTINLSGTTQANAIEVERNTTLTLNSPFGGTGALTKGDFGTLVLNANNGAWAGR